MFVKVCGMTRAEDVEVAVRHGATAVGFVFWPRSPRYLRPEDARGLAQGAGASVAAVGVFVNEPVETIRQLVAVSGVGTVQLHGDEPPSYASSLGHPVVRAMAVESALVTDWPDDVPLLLDAADRERRGGTGRRVDWDKAAALALRRRVILAGGLTPENVEAAVAAVRPFGVDVSTGVEIAPGVKSAEKMARFLERARRALDQVRG
jgi:phosphoribosylanthranilate isomerase